MIWLWRREGRPSPVGQRQAVPEEGILCQVRPLPDSPKAIGLLDIVSWLCRGRDPAHSLAVGITLFTSHSQEGWTEGSDQRKVRGETMVVSVKLKLSEVESSWLHMQGDLARVVIEIQWLRTLEIEGYFGVGEGGGGGGRGRTAVSFLIEFPNEYV